jgi:hypothetical protein
MKDRSLPFLPAVMVGVLLAAFVVGCSGAAQHSPTQTAEARLFTGLPYAMDLPEGWVGGGPETFEENLRAVERANPELYAAVREKSPPVGNQFVGLSPDGALAVAVNTLPVPPGWDSLAAILDESERQNVEGIAALPGVVGQPTAERVTLPFGEAVRITWTTRLVRPDDTAVVEGRSIGYAVTDGNTIYTAVFGHLAEEDHTAEIEQIIRTFREA